ncbi:alpha-hydroxy acid oxidase [Comamonas composti]|uniref:alpha-hydroxy acid oxidase n=1 Tax=Comamonas composti TaxID=408558 RepID=UPI000551CD2C|nr:alpha-hydroxy acid oxidase [Comamonas composti]
MTPATPLNSLGQPLRAAHARIPAEISSSADYERHAVHHIEAQAWRHIQGGCDQERGLAHNRQAFDRLRLLPAPMADLRGGHTRLDLLGQTLAHPLLIAPLAYQALAHAEGELASVRAAMALQAGYLASTLSSHRLEEIAAAAHAARDELGQGAPLWFQLYSQPTREHSLALVRRAEAAGYEAIVWTVDASVKRSGFALPSGVEAANLHGYPSLRQTSQAGARTIILGTPLADAAPSLDELAWLRASTQLPLIVKGVLNPRLAREAVAHGADALVISNHGARVLDGVVSPLEVLPSIRQSLPATPLLLDSGVRWGTDAVKALALGANAVLLGRPVLHALAVAGMLGVAHLLHLLRTELELAMAQLGCATLEQLGPDCLWNNS